MANAELNERLKTLLKLKLGTRDILKNRENTYLEFKETFNLGSRAKYARTLASFSNNKGGYIVFGVTKEPHKLKGLNMVNFESCDPAKITEYLNSHFSPELAWDMDTITFHEVSLGYLYAHEISDKPIIATSTDGNEIQEAIIYYRYRGQSTAIKFPELRTLFDERIARERRAWIQHLTTIGRAGPTNVGVIDTIRGKVFGGGSPFLIDEGLLRKLKFIRAGQFSEAEGAPALRLVGDVQPVAGVIAEKQIPVGIHSEDLYTAFLAQRPLRSDQAKAYLKETAFQSTPFVPIHYFSKISGIGKNQVQDMFKGCKTAAVNIRNRIIQRLYGGDRVNPIGGVDSVKPTIKEITAESVIQELKKFATEKEKRSFLVYILRHNPNLLSVSAPELSVQRFMEAVTHLSKVEIQSHRGSILESGV
jgi:hypothetical protein